MVIGLGNVAVDVVRMLLTPVDQLRSVDFSVTGFIFLWGGCWRNPGFSFSIKKHHKGLALVPKSMKLVYQIPAQWS